MCSLLSPIIAKINRGKFEEEAIDSATDKPSMSVHYVDDTFVIWPHGEAKLQVFFSHQNSRRESIKFTMEKCNCDTE